MKHGYFTWMVLTRIIRAASEQAEEHRVAAIDAQALGRSDSASGALGLFNTAELYQAAASRASSELIFLPLCREGLKPAAARSEALVPRYRALGRMISHALLTDESEVIQRNLSALSEPDYRQLREGIAIPRIRTFAGFAALMLTESPAATGQSRCGESALAEYIEAGLLAWVDLRYHGLSAEADREIAGALDAKIRKQRNRPLMDAVSAISEKTGEWAESIASRIGDFPKIRAALCFDD